MTANKREVNRRAGQEAGLRSAALRLSPAASLVLDVARFAAALAVLLGHLTLPNHSSGLPNLMSLASGAVGVFFVLSGFVIRYATTYRVASLAEYTVDRASRLFSVVLPALVFTVAADLTIRLLSPQPAIQAGDYLLRIAATLSFTGQIWSLDLTPHLNMPFWSLSFEAFYYAIYGFAFYLRGWRRTLAVCAGCLLAGPSILFMARYGSSGASCRMLTSGRTYRPSGLPWCSFRR